MDERTKTGSGWNEISVPVHNIAQVLHEQTKSATTPEARRVLYTLVQQLVNRIRQNTPTLDEERFLTESGITEQFRRQAA